MKMALEHGSDDPAAAFGALVQQTLPHIGLAFWILAGVCMTAIDHECGVQTCLAKRIAGGLDIIRAEIRAISAATEDDMAVGIASGLDDARRAILIDTEKTMRCARGAHGIDGSLHTAVCCIFKTHGHREPAGHFAVGLGFSRPRTDRRPADEVGNVLRHDGVEKLGRRGESQIQDVEQELAGEHEA